MSDAQSPLQLGRYLLYDEIASGGMASVHLGRLAGSAGFSRTVAIKRLHPHCAKDKDFVTMFIDEARLAARIQHPNVVSTLDVVRDGTELFIVMDYIAGESLANLLSHHRKKGTTAPIQTIATVIAQALHGLHAAHTATDTSGDVLGIVHRDMSPQNIIVGTDGVSRVLDFGVAKARGRLQTTREGQIKGKLAYMPPEQLRGAEVTIKSDLYAVGVVIWEALAGQRLFRGDNEGAVVAAVLAGTTTPPSAHQSNVPSELDTVVLKALASDPTERFQSAREMATALESAVSIASAAEIGEWVQQAASDSLVRRATRVSAIENSVDDLPPSSVQFSGEEWTGPDSEVIHLTDTGEEDVEVVPAEVGAEHTKIALTQSDITAHPKSRPWRPVAAGLALVVLGGALALLAKSTDESPSSAATHAEDRAHTATTIETAKPQASAPSSDAGSATQPSETKDGSDDKASDDDADEKDEKAAAKTADDREKKAKTKKRRTTTSTSQSRRPRKKKEQVKQHKPPVKAKPVCKIVTVYDPKQGIKIPKQVCN